MLSLAVVTSGRNGVGSSNGSASASSDCGSACVGTENEQEGIYWSCPAAGGSSCALASGMTLAAQAANPVASFPTANIGSILRFASIGATEATTGTSYLVFGIGTESYNKLGGATLLIASDGGVIPTIFDGGALSSSFIGFGSNALFFGDSTLAGVGLRNLWRGGAVLWLLRILTSSRRDNGARKVPAPLSPSLCSKAFRRWC
jgi:hypothetical protein